MKAKQMKHKRPSLSIAVATIVIVSLCAVYAANGHKPWSDTIGGLVTSSPAVANGVVFVGSWDGHLYAVNAQTGAKL